MMESEILVGQAETTAKIPEVDDPLVKLQHEVQRKLGRCMIRLQQYERMMKTMVAHMAVDGPPEQLQGIRDKQVACASTKSLGQLVGMFTGSYLAPATSEGEAEPTDAGTDEDIPSQGWFRMRYQLSLSAERYAQTKQALAELVTMRNELVHHFLDRFNIWQEHGCRAADVYLDACFEKIDGHALNLTTWAKSMENARALAASVMQSRHFEDFVHGIQPDGTIQWPISTIVECLRNAEGACAVDGWTLLNSAIGYAQCSYPDHNPNRYGFSSWRHVIHASQQFDIRKEANAEAGCIEVWYRSRQELA